MRFERAVHPQGGEESARWTLFARGRVLQIQDASGTDVD